MPLSRLWPLLAVPLLATFLAGCADDRTAYCDALTEEQQVLTDLSEGSAQPEKGTVARTVEVFEGLRERAPDDLRDEWDAYVGAWERLQQALADAGADETMFDDGARPPGMSERDYDAISDAALELRSTEVVQAASGIEQHALDVCKVELGGSPPGG